MKLLHLSDLHLGKRVNEFSMLEDQRYILTQILLVIDEERPDAILISGDVYDRTVPPAEAVQLLDDFLCRLAKRQLQVFLISGNHDSAERVAFGGRLMEQSGLHISPVYTGPVPPLSLQDEWGTVNFYLLPFIKPAHVRAAFPGEEIESYTDALRVAISGLSLDENARNVLLTHQFVTGAQRSESEEISVGGADNVDAAVFAGFDYVALGHLHGPQWVEKETIRYCGSPLKYSFSEANQQKSVTIAELREKGSITIRTVPLLPQHDLRELRGSYEQITFRPFYEGTATDDYLHITLTDEEDIPNAVARLRTIYPNLMRLDYDNQRTRRTAHFEDGPQVEQQSPLQLFSLFYEAQNNQPMTEEQQRFARSLMEQIWEDAD